MNDFRAFGIKCIYVLILLFAGSNVDARAETEVIKFNFYTNPISLSFDKNILVSHVLELSYDNNFEYWQKVNKSNYSSLLADLLKYKTSLHLNDWFYYQLITQVVNQIESKQNNDYQTLLKWFLLIRSGYEVIISYDKVINLYVYCIEPIRGMNLVCISGKCYVCLNYFLNRKSLDSNNYPFFKNEDNGSKSFSFKVQELPVIANPEIVEKQITFRNIQVSYFVNDSIYPIKYKLNYTYIQLLNTLPCSSLENKFNIPISKELEQSLIAQFKKILSNSSINEQVRLIHSFVQFIGAYKEDSLAYGEEKWMSPEEALFNQYLDCDDYNSLFWGMVKKLVNIPMIIIDYGNHINIGVHLKTQIGNTIKYNGTEYTVCDPTRVNIEDTNDWDYSMLSDIGEESYFQRKKYEIAYEYHPANRE